MEEIKLFWGIFTGQYLNKWTFSQKCKLSCSLKTTSRSHTNFTCLSSAMEQLLKKSNFEFLHAFNFSCTWNKKASSCRLNILKFWHNIPYMVSSFVFFIRCSSNDWHFIQNDLNYARENIKCNIFVLIS